MSGQYWYACKLVFTISGSDNGTQTRTPVSANAALNRQAQAGHYSSTYAARYRQCHEPCYDDVAEDGPVHILASTESANEHH